MKLTIPIIPTGQARARATVRNGHAMVYKGKKQLHAENALMAFLAQHAPAEPITGPVSLTFTAHMPIPTSRPKSWKEGARNGAHRPCGKPDLDNVAKHLKDCLTTMRFWEDDRQVVDLTAKKVYSDLPRWEIEIVRAI
jgi:Holliday junction resolvase RusA-like endonuclease